MFISRSVDIIIIIHFRDIQGLLPANAILVGHSLSVDLRAMKMFHPHIIDTALIPTYMNTRGRSRKLKDLAAIYLGKNLQVIRAVSLTADLQFYMNMAKPYFLVA